jgi:hypothetical protein
MGNNCCQGQSELDGGSRVERSDDIQTLVDPFVTRRTHDSMSTNPQQKMNDYYKILREAQMSNLKKMREHLKKNPELFLLNNVILAIQFFDNFDR